MTADPTLPTSDTVVVRTREGALRGARDPRGPLRFQGVPFAAPPTGPMRFRPPAPPVPWTGVRDATTPGPVAPQERAPGAAGLMDEDCLYLNVCTPACDEARRPVLVYIHAGAFVTGAGSAPAYSGVHLAADHGLVVVSINYRLGVLGFPPFAVLGDATPRNLGLLDQVAALEWVRDNIAAFGGDPASVTVCGYSAGGWSIAALMGMKAARGLFHRAVPQSGAFMYALSPAGQEMHATAFLAALDLAPKDLPRLIEMPVARLLHAQAATVAAWQEKVAANQVLELDFPFTPVRDGVTLDENPIDILRGGGGGAVPVLVGSTENELGAAPFRMALPWLQATYTRDSVTAALATLCAPDRAEAIWAGYAALYPDLDEAGLAGRIRSDWMYRIPAIRVAEARCAPPMRAWMYRFDLAGGSPAVADVSTHATDVTFWFGSMTESPYQDFFFGRAPNAADHAMSRRMQADLAAFAARGACDWPAYDVEERSTMVYGATVAVEADPGGRQRALWTDVV